MSVRNSLAAVAVVVGTVFVGGCSQMGQSTSPTVPSSASSVASSTVRDVSSGLTASALGTGVNAGWTCLQPPGTTDFICAPPGLGIPSVPPVPDYGGAPTYNLSAFTADHEFIHRLKLLRPDLYHGQPCLGGDPWNYILFLDYYECIIKD